ncbi:MOSC domain-containing protein [Corallococcus aberystwythensis]|uniref:MOSC domain-containing protein n=1 Tax=Corallococcus aberystwythensis TaxID=2316722 RepID=A0A3A8Q9X2_9BACT|nr:MOSC domain-containing protein [Corallococcus aberystwythensis]RKH63820.1 MOSC domain-containing protein [Corallococcus aberystwythensis]
MPTPAPSLTGHLANVLLCTDAEPKRFVTREVPEVKVDFAGIEGDRHAGLTRKADVRVPWFPKGTVIRNTRQLSVVSREEMIEVARTLGVPHVLASWLGANLELVGVPRLTHLPPGTRLFFPEDATLVMEGENLPCVQPGRVIEAHHPDMKGLAGRFVKAAWQKRGLVGWVERPGLIRAGDEVRVMLPPPVTYSLPSAPSESEAVG